MPTLPNPNPQEMLKGLSEHADKHFWRVERYIENLQRFLSATSEWDPQHQAFFDEMMKSVRANRTLGIITTSVMVGLIVFILVYALKIVPDQHRQLVEDLRNANLEIELQESGSDLHVKYVLENESEGQPSERNRLLKKANLYSVGFGYRLSSLNRAS